MILDPILDLFRGEAITIPPLDGAFRPNTLLDHCAPLAEIEAPDNLVVLHGQVIFSSGSALLSIGRDGSLSRLDTFDAPISALAVSSDGALAVALESGRLLIDGAEIALPGEVACITALAYGADGALWLANGSAKHPPSGWVADLMEKGASGSVWRRDQGGSFVRVADGLAFPYGLYPLAIADEETPTLSPSPQGGGERWGGTASRKTSTILAAADATASPSPLWGGDRGGDARKRRLRPTSKDRSAAVAGGVIVSESWRHRLIQIDPGDRRSVVLDKLPGYPARMAPARGGGVWLSIFAPRNRLVEFVLQEEHYRRDMMAEVPREYWIAPALASRRSFLEPLQCGGIKTMGVHKPWAPSRSCGMVVRLDPAMAPLFSLHSRANGGRHGTCSAIEHEGRLIVAAKGGDCLLSLDAAMPGER
jgi:hypothetical protein